MTGVDRIGNEGRRVNRRTAWRISKDYWKGCARPSPDGSRLARGACPDLENKAEYRIKGLTMGRRSGAQNLKSQEPRYTSDLSRPARLIAPSALSLPFIDARRVLVHR